MKKISYEKLFVTAATAVICMSNLYSLYKSVKNIRS
jgi:hypothetical protein